MMQGITRRDFAKTTAGMAALFHGETRGESGEEPEGESPVADTMRSFRLAAISNRSQPAAPEKNLECLPPWLARARDRGAALACFPELAVTGYLTAPEIWQAAEPVPGPSTRKLEALAKQFGLIIATGIAEKDRGIVYDTYVFVGPAGYLGKSRKMHIPPPEVRYWRGGGVPPVIDIGLAKVGVNVCFDNWFPESSRLVGLQGAEVVFAPFVWSKGKWGNAPDHAQRNREWKEYANRCFPARATDNGIFLVALNACGPVPNGSEPYYGNPVVLIYSPSGKLVAESPDDASDETMVVTDLDHRLLVERRSQTAFHPRFRRPELYKLLSEGDIGPQSPR